MRGLLKRTPKTASRMPSARAKKNAVLALLIAFSVSRAPSCRDIMTPPPMPIVNPTA